MQSKATTVADYLAELPEDRRKAIEAVRKAIRANLDKGIEEGMQYGMIGYYLPHSVYPPGYHCDPKQPLPYASIASQKNHMAIYMFCLYSDPEIVRWFEKSWHEEAAKGAAGKLDMGKSCIRFKKIEDVPLKLIGEAIARMPVKDFIARYEAAIGGGRSSGNQTGKVASKKAPTKAGTRASAKKVTKKAGSKAQSKKKTAKNATKKTPARQATSRKPAPRTPSKKKTAKAGKARR